MLRAPGRSKGRAWASEGGGAYGADDEHYHTTHISGMNVKPLEVCVCARACVERS